MQKFVYFAIGELFKDASRAEMFIGEGNTDWVKVCCYISVNICSEKHFCTDCEEGRKKYYAAANGVIFNTFALSEECYMHILRTQYIPILTFGAVVRKCKNKQKHKLAISFNNIERK